mgnify:CR=1 FL=1
MSLPSWSGKCLRTSTPTGRESARVTRPRRSWPTPGWAAHNSRRAATEADPACLTPPKTEGHWEEITGLELEMDAIRGALRGLPASHVQVQELAGAFNDMAERL